MPSTVSSPRASDNTRDRTSMDIGRPTVDPSILGIPQGWEDDPDVVPTGSRAEAPEAQSTSPPPWRQRVKRSVRTKVLSSPANQQPHATIRATEGDISHTMQATRKTDSQKITARHDGSRRMAKGIDDKETYQVGYERDTLDAEGRLHEAMCDLLGGHTLATFGQPPERVLDLGTGLGLWPLSMAKIWKETTFVGLDRSHSQIDLSVQTDPSTVERIEWLRHDFLRPLPYSDSSFDYVHMRFVGLGIPEQAWPALLDDIFRVLKSGGKLEIVETRYDPAISDSSLQDCYSSFLAERSIPDDPARVLDFLLPMLQTGDKERRARLVWRESRALNSVSLTDAAIAWAVKSLDGHSLAHPWECSTSVACAQLAWSIVPNVGLDTSSLIRVWVITKE